MSIGGGGGGGVGVMNCPLYLGGGGYELPFISVLEHWKRTI